MLGCSGSETSQPENSDCPPGMRTSIFPHCRILIHEFAYTWSITLSRKSELANHSVQQNFLLFKLCLLEPKRDESLEQASQDEETWLFSFFLRFLYSFYACYVHSADLDLFLCSLPASTPSIPSGPSPLLFNSIVTKATTMGTNARKGSHLSFGVWCWESPWQCATLDLVCWLNWPHKGTSWEWRIQIWS